MIGLVTDEAKALIAEVEKRRKAEREQGGTPLHAAAEGHAEHLEEEKERREESLKVRHPATGRFTTGTAWPGADAHAATAADGVRLLRVCDPVATAPEPQTTSSDRFSADHGERTVHQGTATLHHLDFAGNYPLPFATPPVPLSTRPAQVPFHIAPTGSTSV